jgi:hypothetical protein
MVKKSTIDLIDYNNLQQNKNKRRFSSAEKERDRSRDRENDQNKIDHCLPSDNYKKIKTDMARLENKIAGLQVEKSKVYTIYLMNI